MDFALIKWGVTSNLHSLLDCPNHGVVCFILIVLVCKQQNYSIDGELHFILIIKQAVPFSVSKQLEQPGVEPEAALSWNFSPTDISEALFFQRFLCLSCVRQIACAEATHTFTDTS